MIDIPERVQDALRDGGYRKNYRIHVLQDGVTAETSLIKADWDGDWDSTSITEVGLYRFSSTSFFLFRWERYSEGGQATPTLISGEYVLEIELPGANTRIMAGSDPGTVIKIEKAYYTTIDNNTLVKEQVKFDERMCSDETIKFGLCEGTTLEFQYFDNPNITGKKIKAYVDVQYRDADKSLKWYTIPMGYFDVKECSYQMATGIRKCSAYNKLMSSYLDQKANEMIAEAFSFTDEAYIIDILEYLLNGYGITAYDYNQVTPPWETSVNEAYCLSPPGDYHGIPFKYNYTSGTTGFGGDRGPLGPALLTENYGSDVITTAKNIYLDTVAYVKRYDRTVMQEYLDYPIRIKSIVDLNDIYEGLISYERGVIFDWLNKMGTEYPGTIMQDLYRMINTQTSFGYYGFPFYVDVTIADPNDPRFPIETKRFTCAKDPLVEEVVPITGTFDELFRTTFRNVHSINIVTPKSIRFGITPNPVQGAPGIRDEIEYASSYDPTIVATNEVYLFGTGRYYLKETVPVVTERYSFLPYEGAKYKDGTLIPENIYDKIMVFAVSGMPESDFITVNPSDLADVTLRELQTAAFELECQFGRLDRETDVFRGIELNGDRLFPAEDLYPANDLYPAGAEEGSFRSQYSKLWFDEGGISKWKYLIITYKGLEEDEQGNVTEKDFTLQRTVNADGDMNYNMSDNWLFRNLIWTEEQVGEYADRMVAKMRDITWFPFEMWAAGLPYIETGDEIEIVAHEYTYVSYVLHRQLKGIQNLQDTFINGQLDVF